MGDQISIKMQDGFELNAYRSMPSAQSKGVVVVIQEIFGVNAHIREVADGYAAQGYSAIAPALFDRIERDIELGYAEADMGKGIELAFQGLEMAQTMQDLQSVVDLRCSARRCWGGRLLFWRAANLLECLPAQGCGSSVELLRRRHRRCIRSSTQMSVNHAFW